jgi:capsule polysaccharide export protein-like protein
MQNDDKKILLGITSVNEVKESSEKSGSSSDPSQKLSMIKTWWQHRSVFEKEFCGFVALPTLLTCSYFALVASPMYVSETQFAIKDVVEQRTGIDIASQIFKTSSSSVQNARIVEAYLQSPDLFNALDRELKMVEHYSSTSYDLISRLSKESTAWDKEVFWSRISQPKLDVDSGIVTFNVRAYDPKMAQSIVQAALRASENLVNEMNERSRKDAIKLASNEVKVAQQRVTKAQKDLEIFRNEHRELDPKATASGLQTVVFELEGERSKVNAQLEEARSYMRADAPMVKSLEKRLVAVEAQLQAEKARIAGNEKMADPLNSWVSEYENLMIESEFAQKQLISSMAALEQARAMALVKTQYIVPIQHPTLPDESRYPRTWIFTLCAFFGFFFLYGMVRLIIASIREHAGF